MPVPPPSHTQHPSSGAASQQSHTDAINRGCFQFAVLLGATLILTYLPLPIRMTALATTLWAIGVGSFTIVKHWDSKQVNAMQFAALGIGVGVSFFIALLLSSTFIRWDTDMQLQQCMSEAVTNQARTTCINDYRESLTNLLP